MALKEYYELYNEEIEKSSDNDMSFFVEDIWKDSCFPNNRAAEGSGHYKLNYSMIESEFLKFILKKYIYKRMSIMSISFGSAQQYIIKITKFLNFYAKKHTGVRNFKKLSAKDFDEYIEYLNSLCFTNEKIKKPSVFINQNLKIVKSFFNDLSIFYPEYTTKKNIELLIPKDMIPKCQKQHEELLDKYIPDSVMVQIVENIGYLEQRVRMVIIIMISTGLRIIDVVNLKKDALICVDNNYFLKTDIIKTNIKSHRIPITSNYVVEQIKEHIDLLNRYPETVDSDYMFPSYRYGNSPVMSTRHVSNQLNKLCQDYNITDENGKIFKLRNHMFRHTFAINCINNGVGIATLSRILGHRGAEMTMAYAKIKEETQIKELKEAYENGAFVFEGDRLIEFDTSNINDDAEWSWKYTHESMQALYTPYGTCMKRKEFMCDFGTMPPCLTCNSGKPCKNLLITKQDIFKYEIHIKNSLQLINIAKQNGREDWIPSNENMLKIYDSIITELKYKDGFILGIKNRLEV